MKRGAKKNPASSVQGSTSTLRKQGGPSQSTQEYVNLDGEENEDVPQDQNVNEAASIEEDDKNVNGGEEDVKQKCKRQKKSVVWEEFIEVTDTDGKQKVECIHCNMRLAISKGKPTSAWIRHMNICLKRKEYMRTQRLLNFQPVNEDMAHNKPPMLVDPNAKYDANKMRESIAHWLMATEQPFTTVEDDMFVYMMKMANPRFERLSRTTIKADCFKVYDHEKKNLKALLSEASHISLTTDCWKSSHQKIEYMVITGHFIDINWRLQKRVLSFVHVPPPRTGLDIAHGIYNCLKDWEIEGKIFSISVDNASYNDRVVSSLKDNFARVKKLPCGGRLFHVRCCAHILNLLVKDGLSKIDYVIETVREAVKYINYSEQRRQMFSTAAQQLQVHDRKLLIDVPTRWNSTFDMLSLAINFKDVFPRYAEYEPHFKHLPTEKDWENVKNVCEFLKVFKECTNVMSGTSYPTSNLYLMEVYKVKKKLNEGVLSRIDFIRNMAGKMKEKFDKYWGECHLLMAMAAVLDPRLKLRYIEFCYPLIYPEAEVEENIADVKNALDVMYQEYLEMYNASINEALKQKSGSSRGSNTSRSNEEAPSSGWDPFEEFLKDDVEGPNKSELNVYYDEGVLQGHKGANFNVLDWWNTHKLKYPVLSNMASNILAVPISTVASEATFSAGGRVIDPYRSTLAPTTVEMLICGGDWIRQMYGIKKKIKKDEMACEVLLPSGKKS